MVAKKVAFATVVLRIARCQKKRSPQRRCRRCSLEKTNLRASAGARLLLDSHPGIEQGQAERDAPEGAGEGPYVGRRPAHVCGSETHEDREIPMATAPRQRAAKAEAKPGSTRAVVDVGDMSVVKVCCAERRVAGVEGQGKAFRPPFNPSSSEIHAPCPLPPRSGSTSLSEPCPVEIVPGSVESGILILCDHALHAVPPDLGRSRPAGTEFERHIAYDIGAAAVTCSLARRLGAPAILTQVLAARHRSQRGGTIRPWSCASPTARWCRAMPGGRGGGAAAHRPVLRSLRRCHCGCDPQGHGGGHPPVIVTVHSFTPARLAAALACRDPVGCGRPLRQAAPERAQAEDGLVVGDNEPYDGALAGDTVDRHAPPGPRQCAHRDPAGS